MGGFRVWFIIAVFYFSWVEFIWILDSKMDNEIIYDQLMLSQNNFLSEWM